MRLIVSLVFLGILLVVLEWGLRTSIGLQEGVSDLASALLGFYFATTVTAAVASVFLYRLATFWIPTLPRWGSIVWLERHDEI